MSGGIRLLAISALAFMAALTVLVSSSDTNAVPQFEPGGFVCFEVTETAAECDGDSSPGAVTDLHGRFCVGYNQDCSTRDATVTDSNFGAVVAFSPASFVGPDTPPIGAIVGRLSASATLGLLGNPCSSIIAVNFTLLQASTNISDTIDPKPAGVSDAMEPMALDANGNGLPDGVDKYPGFLNETFDGKQPIARLFGVSKIQGGWVTLNFVFFNPGVSFDVGDDNITLDSSLGVPAVTVLQNPEEAPAPGPISDFCAPLISDNFSLGYTMDNPCTPTPVDGASCPGGDTVIFSDRGYPLFPCETGNAYDEDGDGKINDGCPQSNNIAETGAQCDNNISDDGEDSDINDGCPQFGDQSEGARIVGSCSGTDEGGCIFRQNPAAGTEIFTTLTASQRDADGDGIENSLDVCVLDANSSWDPRNFDPVNDPDFDGLANICDPEPDTTSPQSPSTCPTGIVGPDEDQDCFSNRQDNCPLVNQLRDPDSIPRGLEPLNLANQDDEDSDGIGDACDPDPNNADAQGEPAFICLNFSLEVGGAKKSVATYDDDQSLDCAASQVVQPAETPTDQTPTPVPAGNGGGGNGGDGIDSGPDTGIGSLSPTATNVSIWAIALAAVGGVGILTGVRVLRSRRVDRRD